MRRALALVLIIPAASGCDGADGADTPAEKPLATRTSAPIAFLRGDYPQRELLVVDADGSNERTVVQMPREHELNGFSWSPDGRRITFSGTAPSGSDDHIYVVNSDGTGLRTLTWRRDDGAGPVWSPDGNTIAFDRHDDGDHQIWAIRAAGGSARRLTPGDDFSDPSWSPDGTKIAYSDLRGGWIHVMNADGTDKRRITRADPDADGAPHWSPTGDRIAFFVENDLLVVNADGTGRRRVGGVDGEADYILQWSPDGKSIAFSGQIGGRDSELALTTVDGGEVRRLTDNAMQDIFPSWSPDGKALAFLRYRPGFDAPEAGQGDIYVMNADGTAERNLTNSPADETLPLWSPRGRAGVKTHG